MCAIFGFSIVGHLPLVLMHTIGIICYFYTWCAWDCRGVELDLCLRLFSEKHRSSFSQSPPPTIIVHKMFPNNNMQKCDSLPRTIFDHRSLLGSWDPGSSTAATLNARRHAALAVLSLRLRAVTVCSKGQFPRYMKVSSLRLEAPFCLTCVLLCELISFCSLSVVFMFSGVCACPHLSPTLCRWSSLPLQWMFGLPLLSFHFKVLHFPSSCSSFYFSVLLCLVRVLSFF